MCSELSELPKKKCLTVWVMTMLWSVRTANKKELDAVYKKPISYLFDNKTGYAWKMPPILMFLRTKSKKVPT